ncbi:hypothetical protein AB4Z17_00735 [Paenibacillus sp. TAF43_2]|uniref:hypothetical protein n=1 Tax=Paenibacillus sp. TAF43_2 TaxID=3233069 RepID=UPI003F9938F5
MQNKLFERSFLLLMITLLDLGNPFRVKIYQELDWKIHYTFLICMTTYNKLNVQLMTHQP